MHFIPRFVMYRILVLVFGVTINPVDPINKSIRSGRGRERIGEREESEFLEHEQVVLSKCYSHPSTSSIAASERQSERKLSAAFVCDCREATSSVEGRISFGAGDFLITSSHVRIR